MTSIKICQNSSCTSVGAAALVRDIEELAFGLPCKVEEYGCLGKCGKGPNVEVVAKGDMSVHTGVKKFKDAVALIQEEADCEINDVARKVGKVKFEARREDDPEKRGKLLEKCVSTLGGEASAAKSQPLLFASVLVLRAKECLKTKLADALKDAELAVKLAPKWPQAYIMLATVLEASRRSAEGAEAMKHALEFGTGINKSTVKRHLARLERKAKEEAANPAPTPEPEPPAPEPPAAQAKESGKTEASKGAKADAKGAKSESATGEASDAPKRSRSAKKVKDGEGKVEKSKTKAANGTDDTGSRRTSNAQTVDDMKSPRTSTIVSKSRKTSTASNVDEAGKKLAVVADELPEFIEWNVKDVKKLNHDCILMVLDCSDVTTIARQPEVGAIWHVDFLKESGMMEEIKRAYTPVSDMETYRKGELDIMVKVYPNGQMTRHLASLRPGSQLLVSAPIATHDLEEASGLVIIAGGSAVTVALQIATVGLRRFKPATPVMVVLCNRSAEDVLYKEKFEELLEKHPQFRVVHCISGGQVPAFEQGKAEWRAGRIAQDVLADTDPGSRAVVSGPMGLCQAAVNLWSRLGRSSDAMTLLDELPPMPSEEQQDAPSEDPARADSAENGEMRHAPGTPAKDEPVEAPKVCVPEPTKPMAAPPMSIWCSIMKPFWCNGREVDKDDSEGLPTISVRPS